jgi:hypothetical protein
MGLKLIMLLVGATGLLLVGFPVLLIGSGGIDYSIMYPEACATCTAGMKALMVEGGGTDSSSKAPNGLGYRNFTTTLRTTPIESQVLDKLKSNEVFAFHGHSTYVVGIGEDCIILDYDNYTGWDIDRLCPSDLNQTLGPSGCPPLDYKLVYTNTCSLWPDREDWMTAFNAECFVGWDNIVDPDEAEEFDLYLWESEEEIENEVGEEVSIFNLSKGGSVKNAVDVVKDEIEITSATPHVSGDTFF